MSNLSESTQRDGFSRPYTTSVTRTCEHCSRDFNVKGFTSHERACKVATAAAKRDREYELRLEEESRLSKRSKDLRVSTYHT